jgi:hypothetical protein
VDLNVALKVAQIAALKEDTSAVRRAVLIADQRVDTKNPSTTSLNTKSANRAEKKVLTKSHADVGCSTPV